ncbi:MAG: LysM peptidoglycan-binding domain-containing protein [Cyclobacteriaceae bacterium]|nr:LysM peptidoglycan-binding domain-containing protein [Cyclobacteriaceae bacterium]
MRLTAIFVFFVQVALAQSPEVPHKLNFAGITLTIRDDARREIQKDVDALTQYPKYFNIKVERAKTYFPIIEKIFKEENLPDDFKFLVLQESALIADAVSVSNAVGFWQFKDFTAVEMGLRVDKEIDERMNIVSSTRAAAQYLKKNNVYFNNWVYALQAYQMGAGGVMRSVKDYESGSKHMQITSQTYWYVKKFLAHKIAFEGVVKGEGEIKILEYENRNSRSLHALAKEVSVAQDELLAYNKWAKKGNIPHDRTYVVAIPVQGTASQAYASVTKANAESLKVAEHKKLDAKPAVAARADKKAINGILAIKAEGGESATALAKRAGVNLSSFLSYNDLSISDALIAGEYYYLKKKKNKASAYVHVVRKENESLWSVSQQYGVQLRRLARYNPTLPAGNLPKGSSVLLTSSARTTTTPVTEVAAVEVEQDRFFNWTTEQQPVTASISTKVSQLVEDTPVLSPVVVQDVKTDEAGASENDKTGQNSTSPVLPVEVTPDLHTVAAGETLYAISKRYNVGVMDLVSWNQLKLEEGIKPGQVLKLKGPVEEEAENKGFVVYEVRASDTLYSVARKYDVTIKELMDWNQKKDFSVSVGEKLRIQVK